MSEQKEQSRNENQNTNEKVSPIAPEDILIITELAQIGLKQLTDMMPSIREVVAKGGAELTEEHLKHFESLVLSGPDTITHFSNICQYMADAAEELKSMNVKREEDKEN